MNKIRILFMGRKNVAAKTLEWLLKQDRVEIVGVLTDSHLEGSPCAKVAKENGLNLYDVETALGLADSEKLQFDLGLSVLYWRKLRGALVNSPRLKTINFHPAPLPEYKGTAGYNLAIMNGLSEWSMTAHYIDEQIDTGDIIRLKSFPICKDTETAQSLENTSQHKLFELFVDVVSEVLKRNSLLKAKPNKGGLYISRAQMEEMKEIKEGDDVSRKIRAFWFPPYDGAYIKIAGKKYTLVDDLILSKLAGSAVSKVF